MSIFNKIIVFLVSGMLLSACYENPDCIGLKNNLLGVSFKKLYDGKEDTVGVFGISLSGTDSVFDALVLTTGVTLPLNFSENQQEFNFNMLNGQFKLTTEYVTKAQFESPDCGPRFVFSDLVVTQHNFDSLRLLNATPASKAGTTNIAVYRCPYTNNVKIGFRQLLADTVKNGKALKEDLHGIRLDFSSLIYWADTTVSTVVLPLNLNAPNTKLTFDSKVWGLEQLAVSYTLQPRTLFEVCGEQNFIDDLQITGSDFDIARIHKDSIADPPVTNILLLRCPQTNLVQLKLTDAANASAKSVLLKKVSASYTSTLFYVDSLTSSLILPLDESKDQTDFTLEFENSTKQLSVGYVRTAQTFHEQCDQTLFSSLKITAADFTTAPKVLKDSIQFPVVENIEVITN